MSSILFLVDMIAFLVVVVWTYTNDGAANSGEKGLLGMKVRAGPVSARGRGRIPLWKLKLVYGAAPARPRSPRPTPGWRRRPQRPPGD
jgi:hypothetical protein